MPHDQDPLTRLAALLVEIIEDVGPQRIARAVAVVLDGGSGARVPIEVRMKMILEKHPEAMNWTAEQFRQRIGNGSSGAIRQTQTWKRLVQLRESERDRLVEETTFTDRRGKRQPAA